MGRLPPKALILQFESQDPNPSLPNSKAHALSTLLLLSLSFLICKTGELKHTLRAE